VEALIAGWGKEIAEACAGRHVLSIQDTSEINFTTTQQRDRGLGEIGKGVGRGLLLHAMLGLDAETGHFGAGIGADLDTSRPGSDTAPAAFSPAKIETLHARLPELEGKTALQKNPHPPNSLPWAAWIIAKLGGWEGYPKSKPPGPITFRHGPEYFRSIARWMEAPRCMNRLAPKRGIHVFFNPNQPKKQNILRSLHNATQQA
jgi:hypothetical protein